jgi:hypothetical protein
MRELLEIIVRFEILTALNVKGIFFWNMIPCTMAESDVSDACTLCFFRTED